jgi:hypothetical protein
MLLLNLYMRHSLIVVQSTDIMFVRHFGKMLMSGNGKRLTAHSDYTTYILLRQLMNYNF